MKLNRSGLGGVLALALGVFSLSAPATPVDPGPLGGGVFGEVGIGPIAPAPGPDTFPLEFIGGKSIGVPDVGFFVEIMLDIPGAFLSPEGATSIALDLTEDGESLGVTPASLTASYPGSGTVVTWTAEYDAPGGDLNINDIHVSCSPGPTGGPNGVGPGCTGVGLVGYAIGSDDGDVELRLAALPEPGVMLLLSGGLLLAGGLGRRRAAAA